MITGVYVDPREPAYAMTIPNSEGAIKEILGGDIEEVFPYEKGKVYLCNSEGKYGIGDANRVLFDEEGNPYDVIHGGFFIVGIDEETGEYCSLDKKQIKESEKEYQGVVFWQKEHKKHDGMDFE